MPNDEDKEQHDALAYYTLAHPGSSFIHQHFVDAYTAQHADESTRPIAVAFALIGLYLHLERSFTGRDVQRAHTQLARKRRDWPRFRLPEGHGDIGVADVLALPAGRERDEAIERWCASVWSAWRESRDQVAALVRIELDGIQPTSG